MAVSFTLTMVSPSLMPAFIAGESSMGEITTISPSLALISMPTPTKSPLMSSLNSVNDLSSRKRQYGSSRALIMPRMAP